MKPVKTEGNFVVYENEVERPAFAMESDVRLFQGCVDSWVRRSK